MAMARGLAAVLCVATCHAEPEVQHRKEVITKAHVLALTYKESAAASFFFWAARRCSVAESPPLPVTTGAGRVAPCPWLPAEAPSSARSPLNYLTRTPAVHMVNSHHFRRRPRSRLKPYRFALKQADLRFELFNPLQARCRLRCQIGLNMVLIVGDLFDRPQVLVRDVRKNDLPLVVVVVVVVWKPAKSERCEVQLPMASQRRDGGGRYVKCCAWRLG